VHTALLKYTRMPISNYYGRNGYIFRDDLAGLNLTTVPKILIETGNMRNARDGRAAQPALVPEAPGHRVHPRDRHLPSQALGSVFPRACGAGFPASLRGALRRCLPSSLRRSFLAGRSSVQVAPRLSGSLAKPRWRAAGLPASLRAL